MRKPLLKALRQQVYNKYNGHCAYCGKEIKMSEMQVDHATAFAQQWYAKKEKCDEVKQMIADDSINNIDNLMPACRACNFYKGINDIDGLRRRILTDLEHTCRSTFQTRLAMQYGMIEYKPWDGKFYFEKGGKKKPLHLVLTEHWYDMIASGEKKEEYRDITAYWVKRLYDKLVPDADGAFERRRLTSNEAKIMGFLDKAIEHFPIVPKPYTEVTFQRAYPKNPPRMTFTIESITIGTGNPDWGAEPGKKYFVIKLGRRLDQ